MNESLDNVNCHSKDHGLHYNFVFFFARDDYWRAILGKELYESKKVHVYEGAFGGHPILQKIFRMHWAYRINRHIQLPFKRIWFRRMYAQCFPDDDPLCFVYMGGNSIYSDGGFTDYVKKRDSRNRQVILHNDLISKKLSYDYAIVRNKVDLATIYDAHEAEEYDIHYFREDTYSMILDLPDRVEYESDVYFLGAAKDRLHEILSVYSALTQMGLACKFLIAGVDKKDRWESEGIKYIHGISYEENIKHVIRTKCVLEIIQGGSVDITTRALEAIAYRRKLLTNCQTVPREYFNEGQLQVYSDAQSIDQDFFKHEYTNEDFKPRYDMNPLRRLYDIQEQLDKL